MIIKKKKLFLDFDGVCCDTVSAVVSLYNEDFKYYKNYKFIYPHLINTWDFTELNCATSEYINTYFNQQRLFDNLEFMENCKEVLDRLKDYFNIKIVSMGFSPNLRIKNLFCEKNIPYAEFIGVNFKEYPDKSKINMSEGIAFLDDNINNLETSNCPNKFIFGDEMAWNIDNSDKYKRLYNWYEVEKYLMKM